MNPESRIPKLLGDLRRYLDMTPFSVASKSDPVEEPGSVREVPWIDRLPSALKTFRKNAGLTQGQVVELAWHRYGVHMTRSLLSQWENGRVRPRLRTYFAILAVLNVDIHELAEVLDGPKETLEAGPECRVDSMSVAVVLKIENWMTEQDRRIDTLETKIQPLLQS